MQRHQEAVFRVAYRILGRREDAEDAAQETFLLIYRNLDKYTDHGLFWPWARKIAVNVCLKRLPMEIPTGDVEELAEMEQECVAPVEVEILRQVEREQVRGAIEGLPAPYRVVIVLRYLEDMSYREIADELEVPVTTVETRLFRAKKMLCKRLRTEVQDEV
jgi:RNA polymerase sigma-70 factor (ECF subfamily)